jgi:hypothetical protein
MMMRSLIALIFVARTALAGDLWYYDWREPPTSHEATRAMPADQDHHWILMEFSGDPFPGQLGLVSAMRGFERAALLFKRSASPVLGEEYSRLAREWKANGIELQLRFMGTLPTEGEAAALKGACDAGAGIWFISDRLPSAYEATNLATLKSCVRVELVLNRYLLYKDVGELRRIPGIPLGMTNDYLPAYSHVDNFNLLDGNPVSLRVTRSHPDANQVAHLNMIKRLAALHLELDLVPSETQYAALAKLDRAATRRLSLRWTYGEPRDADLAAWARLKPARIQLPKETLARTELVTALRALPSEIVIETFQLTPSTELY